ncbi:DASH complex subunit Duo1, putative [Talaromyces stipitatus ATCC 10500]|uniref:DASH complex subunit DUO1 n=1 Tax=Talaromyces stipitatus (strain ATCC 10500 / CBS 375.48 / QM 6759 / NRRL 1006) TaxID=441959 RepID=B8M7I9_TALSN|nr:DASH complex subunit Duo1, putative [Talaromyces stipitatus ATCC 10500]EED19542.1 DASH complex subunit Duo1, putative [Talaromyces stipitatus ATCC 10500]
MATPSAAEEMQRLQLSDEETEELWNSPSQRRTKPVPQTASGSASADRSQTRENQPPLELEEARELALRNELQTVRNVNQAIEGVLESLERARGNMEAFSRTVDSASTLLNTWTRILAQTEHNQRVLLDPRWQGASRDIAEMEREAAAKQQAAERRERELQERREAAARKAEQEEKARAVATTATGRGRGTTRGRVTRAGGLGRTPSVSASRNTSTSTTKTGRPASAASTRRPVSGIARGSSAASRGRGKP